MPLSPAVKRKPLHLRKLTLSGYQRDDGHFDIEGHLVDTKPFDIPNTDRGGQIQAGESLHEMWVRLTLDNNLQIVDAEAVTDWAPFNHCQGGTHSIRNLIGLKIAPGWNNQVKAVLGGIKGCTHITEMLAQMATTAFQSMSGQQKPDLKTNIKQEKPAILDTCFGLSTDGPVVAREWPDFYRPEDEEKAS
jgi:hypothetical protein